MAKPSRVEPASVEDLNQRSYFDGAEMRKHLNRERSPIGSHLFALTLSARNVYDFERVNARLHLIRNQLTAVMRHMHRHVGGPNSKDYKLAIKALDAVNELTLCWDKRGYGTAESLYAVMNSLDDAYDDAVGNIDG